MAGLIARMVALDFKALNSLEWADLLLIYGSHQVKLRSTQNDDTAIGTAAVSLVSVLFDPATGYESFVAKLPNGDNVSGVEAIGHVNVNGGGPRNAFGVDFDAMGQAWTMKLCEADSDGDGQTNGEELGDPCCEWDDETASTPRWTEGVSNPGDDSSTSDKSLWPAYECSNAKVSAV